MIRWAKMILLWCVCVSAGPAQDAPVKLPERERVHVYLLMGQSNMAGRGVVEDVDKAPHPRVVMLTKELTWAPAVDPLHFDKPTIAGVGLGSSFGRAMAEANPDAVIALVPCAVGGTPLSRWQKDGDLYKQAVVRAKAALKDGVVKGVLWHQGENDAGQEETANNYGERLAQMVRDLRQELDADEVPFLAGELGQFLKRTDAEGKPNYWPVVNEQLAALPEKVPQTALIPSAGLTPKSDNVHFDSTSLREFGKRYAAVMQKLQQTSKVP